MSPFPCEAKSRLCLGKSRSDCSEGVAVHGHLGAMKALTIGLGFLGADRNVRRLSQYSGMVVVPGIRYTEASCASLTECLAEAVSSPGVGELKVSDGRIDFRGGRLFHWAREDIVREGVFRVDETSGGISVSYRVSYPVVGLWMVLPGLILLCGNVCTAISGPPFDLIASVPFSVMIIAVLLFVPIARRRQLVRRFVETAVTKWAKSGTGPPAGPSGEKQ